MHLVTGGAGFIGSHIVAGLLRRGERVRVLDTLVSGKRENLPTDLANIELIEGDLRDEAVVREAVAGVDVIFHHAALASVPYSIAQPKECFDINVGGTINLLSAARDAGCRRVVFASSSSVYGDSDDQARRETDKPNPQSPYAVSKLTGEQLCQVYTSLHGLETVALRYFNVFGPGQDPMSQYAAVIPKFVAALTSGVEPVIYGDGEQSRDFVFVGDVVNANLLAAGAAGAAGQVFNIASGRSRTVNETLGEIAGIMGVDARPRHEPARMGDVRISRADISSATAHLGFSPQVSFADGLARTVPAHV